MATICTTFCNWEHDLTDGAPIGHTCFVLPVAALKAEQEKDFEGANRLFQAWRETDRRMHGGRKTPR